MGIPALGVEGAVLANQEHPHIPRVQLSTPVSSLTPHTNSCNLVVLATPPLTACTPAPARRIVDPATGKAFVNVTLEVYKRSKEESLDLYGYRVPRAQHEHFIQENESFVVYCREDDDLDRFSYRLEEGEFGRIGFFKKEAQK